MCGVGWAGRCWLGWLGWLAGVVGVGRCVVGVLSICTRRPAYDKQLGNRSPAAWGSSFLPFPQQPGPTSKKSMPSLPVEHTTSICLHHDLYGPNHCISQAPRLQCLVRLDLAPGGRCNDVGWTWAGHGLDIDYTMPRTLHPHLQLKRSQDVDHYDHYDYYDHIDPDLLVEDLPSHYHDPHLQAAKRRRVEAIALQYYRARTPVILTARLKGPFGNGWKNPWAEKTESPGKTRRPRTETSPNKTKHAVDKRVGSRDNHTRAQGTTTQSLEVPVAKGAKRTSQASQSVSPEASRAAEDDLEYREHTRSLDDLEIPPASASLPEEHDMSGAADHFSASTEEYVKSHSPLSNPFWLRRPASQRRADIHQPRSSATDASPTRSRGTNAPHSPGQECHLSLPKAPLCRQRSPTEEAVPEDWRSSASASMVISSPVKPTADNGHDTSTSTVNQSAQPLEVAEPAGSAHTDISSSARHRADSAQEDDMLSHNSQSVQYAQAVMTSHTPITVQTDSYTLSSQTQTTGNVQTLVPATVYKTSTSVQSVHHDPVASPSWTSSTSFMYRKIGDAKVKSNSASKCKPRAMNFNSPPALAKDSDALDVTVEGSKVGQVDDAEDNGAEKEKDGQCSHSSRNSIYSTQAAMLLAQLEFQEGTFPAMSSETRRSWTQPQDETPGPNQREAGLATTPLSVFKAPLDRCRPPESVFRGPAVSTQDLFTAVSPFAFSTAKKKDERAQLSSLRFTLLPRYDEESRVGSSPAKSPTPAVDRVPPKEKKTDTSFWSFVTDKGSHVSQESLTKKSRRLMGDVELAQFDFDTSLDGFSRSSNLHFTDGFLRHLGDT